MERFLILQDVADRRCPIHVHACWAEDPEKFPHCFHYLSEEKARNNPYYEKFVQEADFIASIKVTRINVRNPKLETA